MVTVIIVGIVILSLVLIGWIWVSLGNIEKQKKILYIICGIFITWIITFIIYNISKIGIVYENQEIMKTIRKVFVLVFTIINGYVLLPYTFKIFDKINNEEIKKEQIKKGQCHYCPKGSAHSVKNIDNEDLVIFCVVPNQ